MRKAARQRVGAGSLGGRHELTRLKIPTIVLAVVALVIGVSSGAVAAKLITGKDIKDGTVTSADIKNGTLVTKDLKHKGVNGNRLQKATVDGAKLKKGTVGNGKLKDGTITGKKIADGTIESAGSEHCRQELVEDDVLRPELGHRRPQRDRQW